MTPSTEELAGYLEYLAVSTKSIRAQARTLNLMFLNYLLEMVQQEADARLQDLKGSRSNRPD